MIDDGDMYESKLKKQIDELEQERMKDQKKHDEGIAYLLKNVDRKRDGLVWELANMISFIDKANVKHKKKYRDLGKRYNDTNSDDPYRNEIITERDEIVEALFEETQAYRTLSKHLIQILVSKYKPMCLDDKRRLPESLRPTELHRLLEKLSNERGLNSLDLGVNLYRKKLREEAHGGKLSSMTYRKSQGKQTKRGRNFKVNAKPKSKSSIRSGNSQGKAVIRGMNGIAKTTIGRVGKL